MCQGGVTFECSVVHRIAIRSGATDVRFVPKADSSTAAKIPYSISSSASDRNDAGTVNPSALAVVRLMTNSNLFSRSIGRSLGFAPLRIRPHKVQRDDKLPSDCCRNSSGCQQ